jgi:8-oxo-dGTP pyrophosphatase MutT (NUDIX family)
MIPFLFGSFLSFLITYAFTGCPSDFYSTSGSNLPKKRFQGSQYWKRGVTQGVQTLYETQFGRFQIHQVQLENGNVVKDWMWLDETDNINVLVEKKDNHNFLVLQQEKYGLEKTTLAVVGGLIEPHEKPLQAAQRELEEELGLESQEWISLGAYRAAANRGGGTTHTFLARNCEEVIMDTTSSKKRNNNNNNGGGGKMAVGEEEHQEVIELSRDELLDALLKGKFQEIKWTATVALALLETANQ